jgi:hypothetical protein
MFKIFQRYTIFYGAPAQYKNKNNFIDLCHHNIGFGISAEWHFLATSHAEGPCDGVGGTTKCLAARSSLQHQQIPTPAQLYSWAKNIFHPHMYSVSVTMKFNRHHLKFRFYNIRTVVGTRQYHAFLPTSKKL